MAGGGVTHDLTIATLAGTARGFMLARGRNGRRGYTLRDAPTISPRQLTSGELDEASFPAEIAQVWVQEDWTLGLGGFSHRRHPRTYAIGTSGAASSNNGVDGSVDGILRPARATLGTSLESPQTPPNAYTPSGFAVVGTEVWAFVGRDVYSWNYSTTVLDIGTEPLAFTVLYRNGVRLGANTFAPAWYTVASGGYAVDGPASYIYKADADANWTLIADAAGLTNTQCKYMARGRLAEGTEVIWGGYWATIADSTANINLVGFDADDTLLTVTDGTQFAVNDIIKIETELLLVTAIATNDLTVTRGYLGTTGAAHANGLDIYKRTESVHHIRYSSNPTGQGNWQTAVAIGQSDSPITALVEDGDTLLVCKTDGIYAYYTNGEVENLTPQIRAEAHPDNFRNTFNWQGRILLPLGAGGMLELVNNELADISLLRYAPQQTSLHGRVAAIAGDTTKVFLLVHDSAGTQYHMVIGRLVADEEGRVDWAWHEARPLPYTTGTTINYSALFAEGIPSGSTLHHRVWAGIYSTGTSSTPYYYADEGDAEESTATPVTSLAVTTLFDGGLSQVQKTFAQIEFDHNNLGAGTITRTITVDFRVDGGSWLTTLVHPAGGDQDRILDSTTPPETLLFPAGTTGRTLELRFTFSRADTSTTLPELERFRVTYTIRPSALKMLPLDLYLAYNQRTLNGARRGRPRDDLSQLETWDTQAAEVTVVDARGTSRSMVFLPGRMEVQEVSNGQWDQPEYVVRIWLVEV